MLTDGGREVAGGRCVGVLRRRVAVVVDFVFCGVWVSGEGVGWGSGVALVCLGWFA